MSRRLLLLAFITGLLGVSMAWAGGGDDGEDVLRKSGAKNPVSSYPLPFALNAANSRTNPAISTGYYFVDSDDEAPDFWRPDPSQFVDTLFEPGTWRRIISGPKQIPAGYWTDPLQNTYGGYAYFRNPGLASDSTDNAFAGPISIGFPFYFNGVRYDSFYVSTNGLIALSNRRYFYEYDNNGFPTVRSLTELSPGVFSTYDPMSDDTRARTGNGSTDLTLDDWGYSRIASGVSTANATSGIRTTVNTMLDEVSLNGSGAWPANTRPALIAAGWDDMQLSVYDQSASVVDDFGRAYFKRSPSNDKLVVYYVNLTPRGPKTAVVGGVRHDVTFAADNRPGVGEHYSYSCQVTLNRNDSSVIVQYERFFGIAPRNALQPHSATVWMRCNSTVGVTGPSRRLNWSGFPATMPASTLLDYNAIKYTQSTEYLFDVNKPGCNVCGIRATSSRNDDNATPKDFLAIKFKQYKNTLRVINVFYRVRALNANANLEFSVTIPSNTANNYEMLAGETRLGAIQPVAIVQNLTNDIQGPQGVNYTRQGINFKVRFRILNEATGKIVYNTSKSVTDATIRDSTLTGIVLCDVNGNFVAYTAGHFVKPYEFVRVTFPPFEPNPFIPEQIGRMISSVIAEPKDSSNFPIGDQWPFDDTTGLRLFVMNRLTDFNDDVREFHLVGGAAMPSVWKWVNIEADVVDGDEVTNNPPPPRGTYKANNSDIFSLKSPVIRMNRVNSSNQDIPPVGQYGGDEIRSFPINLINKKRAVLSVSYQRTGKLTTFARGFSDNRLIGPEHQVNLRSVNGFTPGYRNPDRVFIEFATPSSDGINGITNIQNWVFDPDRLGGRYMQPFQIWGGGGYARGYDIVDYNRQLDNTYIPPVGGMREDLYDDGKDFEYYKVTIPIPDTIFKWVNEGARNFRFRLRARCLNNSQPPLPSDDEDNFFIDNVKILFPNEVTDVEFSNIQLVWPYTMAPASQATRVPIRVKLGNNTNIPAPAFSVRIQIKPEGNEDSRIYCRTITVPTLAGNREVLLPFPDANFRVTTPGRYKVVGRIYFPGNDLDTLNDSTFTSFTMTFGPSFAYEVNPLNPTNDIPKLQFSGVTGKGLNHRGYASGGTGVTWQGLGGPPAQYTMNAQWGQFPLGLSAPEMYGADAGNSSGQIAMRFTLFSQDTVRGYQAYWAELNQDILNISFSLYPDQGGLPGDQRVPSSTIIRRRGEDETDNTPDPVFGKYVTYLLAEPVVLAPGEYWASVSQMGTEGYELGASESRMGMVTTLYSDIPTFGVGNRTLMVDKNFRTLSRNNALLNDNRFAFELTRFSGDWAPFMPTIGNPGYPHLNAMGTSLGYATFTRGSWIPLLRPFFGERSYANPPVFVPCEIPVELTYFDGRARTSGVDLFWETASEKDNYGFYVERRTIEGLTDLRTGVTSLTCQDLAFSADAPWSILGFVPGHGNSSQAVNYKYYDADVNSGRSYEYRLRQKDVDGRESFSNIVNVVVGDESTVTLEENFPNPVNDKTTFSFRVPYRSNVKLEVYDMMGNLVTTLYNNEVAGSNVPYAIEWNGRNAAGTEVSTGTYMYKLTAGEVVLSKNLTLVR